MSTPHIYGYGVEDCGDRHGSRDESAAYGLCYPGGRPLTLDQARAIRDSIGPDAAVLVFAEGRDAEVVP